MSVVESLPARPLRTGEVEYLNEEGVGAAPFSGMPGEDSVFAMMFVTERRLYGLGFDEDCSGWTVIERAPIENPEGSEPEAWEQIDTAINEWIEAKYGERYGNFVMEV